MRRIAAMAAALALASGLAGAPAAAEEEENTSGSGVIEEVALSELVMNGEVFAVGVSAVLEDEQGGELTLLQLPSLAAGHSADEAAAWFEADAPGADGRRVLRHLRLTGAVPK
jgi:hypothetical protein